MKRIFSSLLVILTFALCASAQSASIKKLAQTAQIIDRYYVDKVDIDSITEQALISMLRQLDPHSQYSNAEETRALNEPLQGNFSGVGIQFNMLTDTLYVIEAIAGAPCARAGVLPGDRIITINDSVVAGVKMGNNDIIKRLRGPKGSKVRIGVKRGNNPELIDFTITRDDIPIHSIAAAYMAAPEVGFIEVSRFAETTPDEFNEAIKKLKKKGMRHLIIDLTSNGGGYLTSATDLASLFLPRESVIVTTRGDQVPTQRYTNSHNPDTDIDRVVVMVDRYSASASEILAGALQDHDRGVIVGRRTFGKGLVQRPFPFSDGSMIRLTIARYYTPSGRCIQKPYVKGNDEQYHADIYDRYASGELTSADSIHLNTAERFNTITTGRSVYGGGGILPDVFVPADTSSYSTYLRDVIARGVINKYAIAYVDANRSKIKKLYKTPEAYAEKFQVTEQMLDDFNKMAQSEGLDFDADEFARSRDIICTNIKALIGRDIFTEDTFRMVFNPSDEIFREALRIITDPAAYRSLLQAPVQE
ncbi:MAG: S41 family peptidase [Paramuribaculum sp.]|nr:S41 family peptidase [Paramuribaculum sp.]